MIEIIRNIIDIGVVGYFAWVLVPVNENLPGTTLMPSALLVVADSCFTSSCRLH
jgi:hypothetical protein